MDSKEYSWKHLTASGLLSHGVCELCEVVVTASNATATLKIYDGENTAGEVALQIKCASQQSRQIGFHHHVYFRRGLYVEFVQKVDYCFIQWRELGHRGEGS